MISHLTRSLLRLLGGEVVDRETDIALAADHTEMIAAMERLGAEVAADMDAYASLLRDTSEGDAEQQRQAEALHEQYTDHLAWALGYASEYQRCWFCNSERVTLTGYERPEGMPMVRALLECADCEGDFALHVDELTFIGMTAVNCLQRIELWADIDNAALLTAEEDEDNS